MGFARVVTNGGAVSGVLRESIGSSKAEGERSLLIDIVYGCAGGGLTSTGSKTLRYTEMTKGTITIVATAARHADRGEDARTL
jgi:hypothetical protein